MGEATETALTVLVEKLNPQNVDRSGLSPKVAGTVCNLALQRAWRKDFTLEFSRDRKSMSAYCTPLRAPGGALGGVPGPKQFIKVTVSLPKVAATVVAATLKSDSDYSKD